MDINEILKMMEKSLPDETLFADELRAAVLEYIEAKFKEISATTKFTEAVAKLGIVSLPSEMKDEFLKTFLSTFQKEISEAIEKTL